MFALSLVQTIRLPGILDALITELESTPSSTRRAQLIRKLARSHMRAAVEPIIPFLAGEPRVRRAAVEALVSLGEDARQPVLDVLGDPHRRDLHGGALLVLAGIVRGDTPRQASRGLWRRS